MRLNRQTYVAIAAAAAVLGLAACIPAAATPESARVATGLAFRASEAPATATVAGYPLGAYPRGSPNPERRTSRPAPTPRPRPTATPTPDYLAALPPGATLRDVERAYSYRWFVLYDLGRQPGVALLEHKPIWHPSPDEPGMGWEEPNPLPPQLLWDFSEEPPPDYEVESFAIRNVAGLSGVCGAPAVLAEGAGRSELLVLDVAGDQPAVQARLPLAELAAAADIELALARVDLTGGGTPEAVLIVAGGDGSERTAVFYQGSGPQPAREDLRIGAVPLLVDLDGDGSYEVVTQDDPGRYRVQSWNGEGYEDAAPIVEPPPPTPRAVADGQLPPLPADLYFVRPDGIYRWPRDGGWLRKLAECRGDYECVGLRVLSDGHLLATGTLWGGDAIVTDSLGIRFVDTTTGTERRTNLEPEPQSYRSPWGPDDWDLTPDGTSLVYLAYGATSDEATVRPVDLGLPAAPLFVVDIRDTSAMRRVATCGTYDAGEEHGLAGCLGMSLAPDGRNVAYSDGVGLWIVPVAGGTPRRLVKHEYGRGEIDIRLYTMASWSPGGSRALVESSYYEGGSSSILDLAGGSPRDVPGSDCCYFGWSDYAWLSDDSAIVHTRSGDSEATSPLLLIDAADPSISRALLPTVLPLAPGQGLNAFGPREIGGSTICFGLRHHATDVYRGNGVSCVDRDGSHWRVIAWLPPIYSAQPRQASYDFGYPGMLRWTPDGSAFVFDEVQREPGERQDDLPDRDMLLVGRTDGSALWDATAIIGDGRDFRWVP
jgi:hypothetical protein